MNIQLFFFISLIVMAIGFAIALINLATFTRVWKTERPMSIVVWHLVAMAFYGPGLLGTFGFGIAWILTYIKH